jgi:NAD(P)H-dependent nitrite reductase small subunit
VSERVKVARTQDLKEGAGIQVQVGDKQFAVFKCDNQVYAVNGVCPHRGGPLGEGFVQGGRVACPWHGWTFDVKTGKHAMNPAIEVPSYPVTVEGDDVYVTV